MQNTFGGRVRWLRESKALSLREFADRLGADPGYLSKIENGKATNPSRRFQIRMAVEFKINSEWLQTGAGDPFVNTRSDDGTKKALPLWSDKRLQRVFAVLDDLPAALGAEVVVGNLLDHYSLEELQSVWRELSEKEYPALPATARLFWNDVYQRLQLAKHDRTLVHAKTIRADLEPVCGKPSIYSLILMESLPVGEPEQQYLECLVTELKRAFEKLPHAAKSKLLRDMAEAFVTFMAGQGEHQAIRTASASPKKLASSVRQEILDKKPLANDKGDMQVIKSMAGLRQKLTRLTGKRGSKAALARKLGVSRQAVDQWLNGTTTPSTDIAIQVMNLK